MKIDSIFDEVRSLYFPRWDRKRSWIVQLCGPDHRRDETGYCDVRAKTIYLNQQQVRAMPDAGIRALLIHEICHDRGAAHHNRRWAARVDQAAKRAEALRNAELVEILRADIFSYCGSGVLANYHLRAVFDYAEELVGSNPSVDLKEAVERVARHFGHSPAKVRRDFGNLIEDVLGGIA